MANHIIFIIAIIIIFIMSRISISISISIVIIFVIICNAEIEPIIYCFCGNRCYLQPGAATPQSCVHTHRSNFTIMGCSVRTEKWRYHCVYVCTFVCAEVSLRVCVCVVCVCVVCVCGVCGCVWM